MKFLFVQTGGTIDKDYPKITNGWGFEISEEPAFQRLLRDKCTHQQVPPSFEYEFMTVCRKDSTEINDFDRAELVRLVGDRLLQSEQQQQQQQREIGNNDNHNKHANNLPFDGVVITHGTDTMAETARFLAEQHKHSHKVLPPILVTGAMLPERFSDSDASFNLGMAIAAVQLSPPGFVGICMHGLVLKHDEIDRDAVTGQFVRRLLHE
mmetsp:Transcript_28432/g.59568  ORF Transcript_28432/g.59568 Transcript_28432/m.59568 type:complete len:209 (+) Transcript_28432:190-816(+)|eukprot:CAMPEP_0168264684 /NCGR_PEP_ID=MMETSP0141_2-20121125/11298_1 /TAXON_ID=44445 /ORGANISM="Pseudo-nitzschia australis, Strain 10249 10 AB" /LENGTH=208 /DNA_ID=CAMNT_0008204025 /DNA_START=123 /DNA_END=749 /DNA_ORIENTATION=-